MRQEATGPAKQKALKRFTGRAGMKRQGGELISS
jgi:hypothetical protein